jgi:hypothetical protein
MVSRYTNNANGNALIIEAYYTANPSSIGHGSGTTPCTCKYGRNYDDDGTKVRYIEYQFFLMISEINSSEIKM